MYLAQRETFQKSKPYGLEHIKTELINQDKISKGIIKKNSYLQKIDNLFRKQKDNSKPDPNCGT